MDSRDVKGSDPLTEVLEFQTSDIFLDGHGYQSSTGQTFRHTLSVATSVVMDLSVVAGSVSTR